MNEIPFHGVMQLAARAGPRTQAVSNRVFTWCDTPVRRMTRHTQIQMTLLRWFQKRPLWDKTRRGWRRRVLRFGGEAGVCAEGRVSRKCAIQEDTSCSEMEGTV